MQRFGAGWDLAEPVQPGSWKLPSQRVRHTRERSRCVCGGAEADERLLLVVLATDDRVA